MLASIHQDLIDQGFVTPIDQLLPHPQNVREHDEDVIRESLVLNGQYGPVLFQRSTGYLLAGNGTYAAALSLGWTHLAAVPLDVDNDEALRILLADNRAAEVGGNDPEALVALLRSLEADLSGTGYTAPDVDELLRVVDAQTPSLPDLEDIGDLDGYEAVHQGSGLKSLTLTYPAETFDAMVQRLLLLRLSEGETFTSVVMRLAADALAHRA